MGKCKPLLTGRQVGIHVDAASGGFIAPFQHHVPPWDFRVPEAWAYTRPLLSST